MSKRANLRAWDGLENEETEMKCYSENEKSMKISSTKKQAVTESGQGHDSLCVYFRVAKDQHVDETLAKGASILHLPAGFMIDPLSQRVV